MRSRSGAIELSIRRRSSSSERSAPAAVSTVSRAPASVFSQPIRDSTAAARALRTAGTGSIARSSVRRATSTSAWPICWSIKRTELSISEIFADISRSPKIASCASRSAFWARMRCSASALSAAMYPARTASSACFASRISPSMRASAPRASTSRAPSRALSWPMPPISSRICAVRSRYRSIAWPSLSASICASCFSCCLAPTASRACSSAAICRASRPSLLFASTPAALDFSARLRQRSSSPSISAWRARIPASAGSGA